MAATTSVSGRNGQDTQISEDDYVACEERLRRLGYSLDALRRVPQPPMLNTAGG